MPHFWLAVHIRAFQSKIQYLCVSSWPGAFLKSLLFFLKIHFPLLLQCLSLTSGSIVLFIWCVYVLSDLSRRACSWLTEQFCNSVILGQKIQIWLFLSLCSSLVGVNLSQWYCRRWLSQRKLIIPQLAALRWWMLKLLLVLKSNVQ